jgi:hypothetical protein
MAPMRKSVSLYSSSEPVGKCDRFPEASRPASQVLAVRCVDQFFKVAICDLKTGRVRCLEICT